MNNTMDFRLRAQKEVARIEAQIYDRTVPLDDIQEVFFCYTFGHMKATMVVASDTQSRYYEISYSNTNQKMYIDVYTKAKDVVVYVGE